MNKHFGSYEPHQHTPLQRRQRIALIVAVACAVASTGGLAATTLIKSPEQARAEAAAPPATLLTAAVEKRVLASTVVTRGSVVAARKIDITPIAEGAGAQVVTGINVKAGDEIQSGQALLAVSGRPLIALAGGVPAYRDLKPADAGTDIAQLQDALKGLGFYTGGDKPGYFGSATKAAVRKLYARAGYDTPDTGGPGGAGDKPALTGARDAIDTAQQAVDALNRRISAGEQPGPADEPFPVQLSRLQEQLRRAQQAQSDLIARTGTKLPLAEFVFVPSFPARVAALTAKTGDTVPSPLISLAVGELAVTVKGRPEQAALLRPGMPVQLATETLGQQATGALTAIGELTTPQGEASSAPYRPLTITPTQPLPPDWAGLDVRVTITSAKTGTEVLVVPLSAISSGADGRTTVSVVDDAGNIKRVEVRAGVSGDGFVEVAPVTEGGLRHGDRVSVSAPA